jgi:lysyl-tRNA synthetase class I
VSEPLYKLMTCRVCGRYINSHGQRNHAEYHVRRGEAQQSNLEDQRRYLNWGIPWPAEYEMTANQEPPK